MCGDAVSLCGSDLWTELVYDVCILNNVQLIHWVGVFISWNSDYLFLKALFLCVCVCVYMYSIIQNVGIGKIFDKKK